MTSRTLSIAAAALVLLGAASTLVAESNFPDLDVPELMAASKEYRHRADVLRKMIGARDRRIGAIQQQANALIQQARDEAAAREAAAAAANSSNQQTAGALGALGGLLPGGGMWNNIAAKGLEAASTSVSNAGKAQVADAAAQGAQQIGDAHGDADSLMAQAASFDAEKKKLAYKARQYEQLADAKDLLAAGEVLRLESERQTRAAADSDKEIDAQRQFVRGMSLW